MAKYKAYPEYKSSKVNYLGDIPKEWKLIKFGITNLSAELGGNYLASEGEQGIAVIKMGNLERGVVNLAKIERIPLNEKYDTHHLLKAGDFLFNTRNSLELVGKVSVWREELEHAIYNSNILRITFDKKFVDSTDFISYLFNSDRALSQLRLIAKGTTSVAAIYYKDLSSLVFAFPPVREQAKIAKFLDHETAQIDTLIEKQQTLIQLLKEKRQAVISHAVTPDENEKSAKLGYFIDLLSGYAFPSNGYKIEPEGNTALLRGINVGVGALKWDETVWWSRSNRDGLEAFELEEGDIVFGMDRPWISAGARVAEVTKSDLPCLLLQRVIRIRANKNTYQPFIKLCLASKEFKFSVEADLTGVSVPHISPDQVKSFPIRDIGYEQQKLITDDVFEKMKVLDLIEDSAEQAIQLMQERRTALISAAVTGKIDVRGWQAPN